MYNPSGFESCAVVLVCLYVRASSNFSCIVLFLEPIDELLDFNCGSVSVCPSSLVGSTLTSFP